MENNSSKLISTPTRCNGSPVLLLSCIILVAAVCMLLCSIELGYGQNAPTHIADALNTTNFQWKTYNSSNLGLSITYPSTWDIFEKQNRFEEGVDLEIHSPELIGPNSGKFSGALLYGPGEATTNIRALTNLVMNEYVGQRVGPSLTETRLIENANLTRYTIDGEQAGAFVVASTERQSDISVGIASEVVVTSYNGKSYLFQFISSTEDFDTPSIIQIRENMFQSIRWLE